MVKSYGRAQVLGTYCISTPLVALDTIYPTAVILKLDYSASTTLSVLIMTALELFEMYQFI